MKTATKSLLYAARFLACAGMASVASAAEEVPGIEPAPPPLFWPFTIGLEAGTTGLGGYGSWRFADHFGLRAGADYFSLSDTGVKIEDIHYNTKLQLLSEPLTLDLYPWKKHSFHVSAGILFNQNQLTGSADVIGTITIDGHPFPVDSVGSLNMKIEQQLVDPYVSIGGTFFHFDHAHRWAMGGELGVAFTGQASASLTRSGPAAPLIDRAVANEQEKLHNWANQYKWWPVLKLTVTFSF